MRIKRKNYVAICDWCQKTLSQDQVVINDQYNFCSFHHKQYIESNWIDIFCTDTTLDYDGIIQVIDLLRNAEIPVLILTLYDINDPTSEVISKMVFKCKKDQQKLVLSRFNQL